MGISINDLTNEITSAVKDYTEDVTKGINKEIDQTSRKVTKEIAAGSPRNKGVYAASWTRKKETSNGTVKYTIYNKKRGSFAHLFEFGHVKRGGGRVEGKAHIRPPYDQEVPAMESRIKSIIRNGG